MQVEALILEIQQLPLEKRFFVMEQTLKSIKEEELEIITAEEYSMDDDKGILSSGYSVSEESLAKDWLSEEDSRWDAVL